MEVANVQCGCIQDSALWRVIYHSLQVPKSRTASDKRLPMEESNILLNDKDDYVELLCAPVLRFCKRRSFRR